MREREREKEGECGRCMKMQKMEGKRDKKGGNKKRNEKKVYKKRGRKR